MANKETHIFIIWSKARKEETKILEDIKKKFNLIQKIYLTWTPELFQLNLSRFYGQKLPSLKSKMKHCGNGEFLLILVEDIQPIYEWRETSSGKAYVNINMFDAKSLYREWTGGGHKIHATNDKNEVEHDLTLLLGKNAEDYIPEKKEITLSKDLIGSSGWSDLSELFYVLNNCSSYVIMRNFEGYPKSIVSSGHDDIDFLVKDEAEFARILGASKKQKISYRAQYEFYVNNCKYLCDIRDINSGYYHSKWAKDILATSLMWNGIRIPNLVHHGYSLLYHAIYHKMILSCEYKKKVNNILNNDLSLESDFYSLLHHYMEHEGYRVVEPKDYSVYYNRSYVKYISKERKLYDFYRFIESKLYGLFKKAKNK